MTEMPLSNQDIERIKNLGFSKMFFINDKNGWLLLKNKDGRCVFNNGSICLIYKDRPEGCRLYPIIYDKDKSCAIYDKYCPFKEKFKISKETVEKLFALISKLEYEKAKRKSKISDCK
jgi:Fe-S-cluster containining protein